jgi:hypothetical protein
VRVDLKDDRFDVTHDPAVAVATLLAAIEKLGYRPEVVATGRTRDEEPSVQVSLSRLPEGLRSLFARARAEDKLVLLHFTGPG